MIRFKWLSVVVALFLTLAISVPGIAQSQAVPNDVTNPASDAGIPALLTGVNSIIRPQDLAVLQFDTFLDPSSGGDPSKLSAAAVSIQLNHKVAQQQVELAIQYLLANRAEIVAGKNPFFNSIYGKAGRKQRVAILAPVSLPGTFNLTSPTLLQSQAQGGGGGGGNQRPMISVGTLLTAGDSVFLVDPTLNPAQNNANNNNFVPVSYPDLNTQGYVVKISAVIRGGINQQGGGGGQNNQNNQNTDFILDSMSSNVPLNTTLSNATAWRVVRFDLQDDPSVYNQVLATYQAIRDALAGFDPTLGRPQQGNTITYHRQYRDINTEYAPGVAQFAATDTRAPLNNLIGSFITANDPSGTISTRGADRLARDAGFSLSDSYAHLDTLYDQTNSVGLANARLTPLLWAEDNNLPTQFGGTNRGVVTTATNEDRDFFHDRQTIFGGLNNSAEQYLGRAFLEEKILFGGGNFFDTNVASSTALQTGIRQQRLPAGTGVAQFTPGGANSPAQPILEIAQKPGTGTPITEKTLRKWQMILASFAEFNTNLDNRVLGSLNGPRNIAVNGLQAMVGGGAAPNIRASDAGNYSLFADMIRVSGGSGIDFTRVEPIGKRGNAGFNPVVPVQ